MKFIISNLSLAMFDSKNFNLSVREINEKEFRALSCGAYSHIGHLDIAEMCELEYNREPVHVRIGDQLFLVQLYRGVLKFYEINVKKEN